VEENWIDEEEYASEDEEEYESRFMPRYIVLERLGSFLP
jgi:hypothetical protein